MWCAWHSQLVVLFAVMILPSSRLVPVFSNDDFTDDLILQPQNPEVEDGHWLTFNCTILPHYTGNYTSRDISFIFDKVVYTNTTIAGPFSALFTLLWTIRDDNIYGGHVGCKLPDRQRALTAIQHVVVVRRPLQPMVTSCHLVNWNYINCSWWPPSGNQSHHTHITTPTRNLVQWRLVAGTRSPWRNASCEGDVDNHCTWNIVSDTDALSTAKLVCVQVSARLRLDHLQLETKSDEFCFKPRENVILDPPRNLTVIYLPQCQVLVGWQAPQIDQSHVDGGRVYWVAVTSQWSEVPTVNRSLHTESITIDCIPNSQYSVKVRVKTNESRVWSRVATLPFKTSPAIPNHSPLTSENALSVLHVERYIRTVEVYWQRLAEHEYHGARLQYVVLMRRPPSVHWTVLSTVMSPMMSCTDVNVDRDSVVVLAVVAKNEVGQTTPDVTMRLPALHSSDVYTDSFTELVVELLQNSTLIWTWDLIPSLGTANLTLFWCRSERRLGRCSGDIEWTDIAGTEAGREWNLTLIDNNTRLNSYGAALSLTNNTSQSGIHWATCIYDASALPGPVRHLQASVPSSADPGYVLVKWLHPPCDGQQGYIRSLLLFYCEYHPTSKCVGEPRSIRLAGRLTSYNLTGLEPSTRYAVWLYSIGRAGQSASHSDLVVVATSSPVFTAAVIAGISVVLVVVLVLMVVVIWILCKYCRRCHAKLWSPLTVTVPPPAQSPKVQASLPYAPVVEYSRISYMRQGSRLSSSSHDSGQFGIAGSTPLVTPESQSESAVVPLMGSDMQCRSASPSGNSWFLPNNNHHHHLHHSPASVAATAELIELRSITPHPDYDEYEGEEATKGGQVEPQRNGACDPLDQPYIKHEWLPM